MADPAVFLDRDGTLIEEIGYPTRPEQIRIMPGVARALARLSGAGYKLVVVTNQSGIARGLLTEEDLDRFHQALDEQLDLLGARLDAYYACPHLPDPAEAKRPELAVDCDCRKPRPGLILRAAEDLDLDLASSWLVGDMWRDVAAGQAAGIRTIKLPANESHESPRPPELGPPTAEAGDIEQAAEIILTHHEPVPAPARAPVHEVTREKVPEQTTAPREEPAVPPSQPPSPHTPPEDVVPEATPSEPRQAVVPSRLRPPILPPPSAGPTPEGRRDEAPRAAAAPTYPAASVASIAAKTAAPAARDSVRPSQEPLTCARCGVDISPLDIAHGRAARRGDFLLCPDCLPQQASDSTGGRPESTDELMRAVLVELRRLGRLRHGGALSMLRLLAYLVQAAALFCGLGLGLFGQERPIMVEVAVLLQLLVIAILMLERNS